MRSRAGETAGVWSSDAGDAAYSRLLAQSAWYDTHVGYARTAAQVAEAQAGHFSRAAARIPRPEVFDELQRRLESAVAANNMPPVGRFSPVIAELRRQLAVANTRP